MSTQPIEPELQFESATTPPLSGAEAADVGVTCATCQSSIQLDYFDLSGQPVCRACRVRLLEEAETPTGAGALLRAGGFGLAAAVAGAVLYYAMIAITDYEVGLVGIAIGYMVGYAVRAGAHGRGGRRFQVLAVVLTYLSVSWAYSALAARQLGDTSHSSTQAIAKDDSAPAAPVAPADPGDESSRDAAPGPASQAEGAGGSAVIAVGLLLGLSLALPIIAVVGSLPGGLISGAIIAFGMQQAWRMTTAPHLEFSGPYAVGASRAQAAN